MFRHSVDKTVMYRMHGRRYYQSTPDWYRFYYQSSFEQP